MSPLNNWAVCIPILAHRHTAYHLAGLNRRRFKAMDVLRKAIPVAEQMMTCQNAAWFILI